MFGVISHYLSLSCCLLNLSWILKGASGPSMPVIAGANTEVGTVVYCRACGGAWRPVNFTLQARMGSIGNWPMAKLTERHLGVSLSRYPLLALIYGRYPPPVGCMLHCVKVPSTGSFVWRTILWGTWWGQLDSEMNPVVAYAPGEVSLWNLIL